MGDSQAEKKQKRGKVWPFPPIPTERREEEAMDHRVFSNRETFVEFSPSPFLVVREWVEEPEANPLLEEEEGEPLFLLSQLL